MIETIDLKINHKPVRLKVDGNRPLLWVLRTDLGLTGTKYGCGESYCGACTVLINDKAVRSCQTAVKDVKGKEVITIEGLAVNGNAPSPSKGLCGARRPAMRLLHAGNDPHRLLLFERTPKAKRGRHHTGHE